MSSGRSCAYKGDIHHCCVIDECPLSTSGRADDHSEYGRRPAAAVQCSGGLGGTFRRTDATDGNCHQMLLDVTVPTDLQIQDRLPCSRRIGSASHVPSITSDPELCPSALERETNVLGTDVASADSVKVCCRAAQRIAMSSAVRIGWCPLTRNLACADPAITGKPGFANRRPAG